MAATPCTVSNLSVIVTPEVSGTVIQCFGSGVFQSALVATYQLTVISKFINRMIHICLQLQLVVVLSPSLTAGLPNVLITPTSMISSLIFTLDIQPDSGLVDSIITGANQTFLINGSAAGIVTFEGLRNDTSYTFKLVSSNCVGTQVKYVTQMTRKPSQCNI